LSQAQKPLYLPKDYQTRLTTSQTLIIPSRIGFRKTLIDYFVKAGSPDFSDLFIGAIAWNRIYDNLTQAVLVASRGTKYRETGFLSYLKTIISEMDYPSATDTETLTIARNTAPTEITSRFIADDSGDVATRSVAGGSQSTRQLMIINLNNSVNVAASGFFNFDELDMPTGLNPFQQASDIITSARYVNQNIQITVYAIAGDFPKATASKATRVHITVNKIEMFTSDDQEGIPVDPDNGNDLAFSLSPLTLYKLPTPFVFNAGDLITFQGEASYDGTNALPAKTLKLFLICVVSPAGTTPATLAGAV